MSKVISPPWLKIYKKKKIKIKLYLNLLDAKI